MSFIVAGRRTGSLRPRVKLTPAALRRWRLRVRRSDRGIRLHSAYECCIPGRLFPGKPLAEREKAGRPSFARAPERQQGMHPTPSKEVESVNSEDQIPSEGSAGRVDRATLLRRLAVGGAALSIPALANAQEAFGASAAGGGGNYPSHPKWKFAFVNHVTTNPFFVPTQYGATDACALVNCSYTWGGSEKADVGEMLNAFNSAVSAKSDGIAVCVVDKADFEDPTPEALAKGIPVLAYNADGARTGPKNRMAYIGQALYESGFAMGQRIATLVT